MFFDKWARCHRDKEIFSFFTFFFTLLYLFEEQRQRESSHLLIEFSK